MRLTDGVHKHTLDNGLTVLIKEDHSSPVVAIYSYVKVGFFNEPDHLAGISHLLEHMFFKGTKRRGVGEIAMETKMLGGYLNASTSYDHTLYYTVLPSENYKQGLDIQSDALIHSIIDPEELRKETEVVIQEAKRKLDTPGALAYEKLSEVAFTKHRMRRWRIGTEEILRSFTRDDFLAFYRQTYRPENIILTLVGDIQTGEALAEVENHYADFEKGTLEKSESPAEPPQRSFRCGFLRGDIQQCHLALGFHTPEVLHEDSYPLEILSYLLGYGRSCRLHQNVLEQKELVSTISAGNYSLPELGMFLIRGTAADSTLRAAEEAIFAELGSIQQQAPSAEELEKAQNLLESSYVFSMQSAAGQAGLLASYEALGDFRMLEDYLQKLYNVRAGDIQRVARKYLCANNCSIFEYVPNESGLQQMPPEEYAAKFPEAVNSEIAQSKRQQAEPPLVIANKSGDGLTDIQKIELDGGTTLLLKSSHEVPIIACGVYAKSGRIYETSANAGITGLMRRTALKGTESHSAGEWASAVANLGTSIDFSGHPDYISCSTAILSKHFSKGWQLLTDVLCKPAFRAEELRREQAQTVAKIQRLKDDMFQQPLELYYANIFQGHPYGLPALGTENNIRQISREDLFGWQQKSLTRSKMLVVAVGDFETSKVRDEIEAGLTPLSGNTFTDAIVPDCVFGSNKPPKLESRDKEQSGIIVGYPGPKSTDAQYYVLTVLQNLVSGLGGRFFEELRGRQSLAYTVAAYSICRPCGGTFFSYLATTPENESRARDSMLKEFGKLTKEPVSAEELQRSIQYTTGTHRIGLETYRSQMAELAYHELMGRGYETIETFVERVKQVSADDILQAAQQYFEPDKCVEGMVKGKPPTDSQPKANVSF